MFVDLAADRDLHASWWPWWCAAAGEARALPITDTMRTRATTAINCALGVLGSAIGLHATTHAGSGRMGMT